MSGTHQASQTWSPTYQLQITCIWALCKAMLQHLSCLGLCTMQERSCCASCWCFPTGFQLRSHVQNTHITTHFDMSVHPSCNLSMVDARLVVRGLQNSWCYTTAGQRSFSSWNNALLLYCFQGKELFLLILIFPNISWDVCYNRFSI